MAASDKSHVIRLRGPWECARDYPTIRSPEYECAAATVFDVRLPVPAGDLVPLGYRGILELSRSFNWPEPLGYRESLWIVVTAAACPSFSLQLNGQPLGAVESTTELPAGWNITERVNPFNKLWLQWELNAAAIPQDLPWVEVQLEVRLDVGPAE